MGELRAFLDHNHLLLGSAGCYFTMAARSLTVAFRALRPALAAHPIRAASLSPHIIRPFHTPIPLRRDPVAESITNASATPTPPPDQQPDDNRNSAYLGEADSDDGFESHKDVHGHKIEAMDGSNSAYLGEADSDDGFESHKDVHGEKLDAVDASHSAYLGEADSDDGFEGGIESDPERADRRHKFEDTSGSGAHGESGHDDGVLEEDRRR